MRPIPRSVMMFAAGFGTRMGDLTATRPKPLIPVAGKALIDHTLDLVQGIRPEKTVVNMHYLHDQLSDHLANRDIHTSLELPDILETGGGLRHALPALGTGPVFTTNTDAIWAGPNPFRLAMEHWDPDQMDALLVCIPPAQAVGHAGGGDFTLDPKGRLTRGAGLIYGGVQIIKTADLHDIPETAFSLNRVWDIMFDRQRLFGVTYPGKWCDVGNPAGITLAETLLKECHV